MSNEKIFTLVASSNAGRYALDKPDGPDITSGDIIEIQLGGNWVQGSVEHAGQVYAVEFGPRLVKGYYFEANRGGSCGLCVGMKVRLIS